MKKDNIVIKHYAECWTIFWTDKDKIQYAQRFLTREDAILMKHKLKLNNGRE